MTGPPVDLLIVGSGIMGAGVAQLVRRAHPSAEIVMIDGGSTIGAVPGQHLHDSAEQEIWERYNRRTSSGIQSLYMGFGPTPDISGNIAGVEPGMYRLTSLNEEATAMPAAAVAWNVGGMGVHWAAATPWPWGTEVFDDGDPERWDRDLEVARELLSVDPNPFAETEIGGAVLAALDGVFGSVSAPGRHIQQMPMAVIRTDQGVVPRVGPNRIFPAIRDADDPHFTLLPSTLALSLEHRDGHVSGAFVRDVVTGAQRSIGAAQTIVCADTIRSPQLLFASHIRPTALGCYLNEHAFLTGRVIVDLDRFGIAAENLPVPRDGERLANSHWLPHSGPAQPFHGQIMDTVYVDEAKKPMAYNVGISLYVPTEVRSGNRLIFSESERDALGMPRITIQFDYSATDLALIEQARKAQQRAAETLGVFDPETESALLPAGSSLHFSGTVRMGKADDGTSVCNSEGQVWGFDNLFVAGNGVIPTSVACNTTLTGMITAVRASRVISGRLCPE